MVIAGGVGSFQPRRIGVPGAEAFEGRTIHYRVRDAASYHGKKLAIFGGGDSALDWVIDFAGKAAAVTHIHRRAGVPRRARLGGQDALAGGGRAPCVTSRASPIR